jgi:hypothetical protein
MRRTCVVPEAATQALFAGLIVAALTIAGCITVPSGGEQPPCQPGHIGDPVLCVKVDVVAGDGSGCTVATGSKKCSAATANKPCPFNNSATKCRTIVTNTPVAGACDCACTN